MIHRFAPTLALVAMLCPTVPAQRSLCTIFARNGGGVAGGAVYFDVTVTHPAGITVTGIETNFGDAAGTTGVGLEVHRQPTGYTGVGPWDRVATSSASRASGPDQSTLVDVTDFCLPAGNWGIALVAVGARHAYTNGNGTNQTFANADLQLDLGASSNAPLTGTLFSPRVWNGCLRYGLGTTPATDVVIDLGCAHSGGPAASTRILPGPPRIGTTMQLAIRSAPASQPIAVIMLGLTSTGGVDLGPIGALGCRLFPMPVRTWLTPTDAAGNAAAPPLAIPDDVSLVSTRFFVQSAIADPGHNALGIVLGSARAATIGCR